MVGCPQIEVSELRGTPGYNVPDITKLAVSPEPVRRPTSYVKLPDGIQYEVMIENPERPIDERGNPTKPRRYVEVE